MSNIDDYLITFDYLSIKYDDSKIISGHAISAYYLSSLDFVK